MISNIFIVLCFNWWLLKHHQGTDPFNLHIWYSLFHTLGIGIDFELFSLVLFIQCFILYFVSSLNRLVLLWKLCKWKFVRDVHSASVHHLWEYHLFFINDYLCTNELKKSSQSQWDECECVSSVHRVLEISCWSSGSLFSSHSTIYLYSSSVSADGRVFDWVTICLEFSSTQSTIHAHLNHGRWQPKKCHRSAVTWKSWVTLVSERVSG